MTKPDWHGQNVPAVHKEYDGSTFTILPLLEPLLEYNEDTITDLLPSAESYGWDENLTNHFVWANNAYKAVYFIPDFTRYGSLPSWFPTKDRHDRALTGQGQVDRFLFLLDLAFGGFLDDHSKVDTKNLVQAILELQDNFGEYVGMEEDDNMEWELELTGNG